MPEPIEYDIVLDYQSTLKTISVAGGYFHDVDPAAVSIDPADHIEILTGTLVLSPFFIIEISPARRQRYLPMKQLLEVVPIDITAAADAVQLVPTSRVQTFERLAADVEKALAVDIERGGRVSDTRIVDKQMGMMVGAQRVIAIIQTEVRLHREYGKPNG